MSIEERINSVKVTINDLLEASEAVHSLKPEDRNWEGRAHLMAIMFKGEPHKAMAIDSRLIAMSSIIASGELPGWALPQKEDGSYNIAEPVWLATASEKLLFVEEQPCFNKETFLNSILSKAVPEGNA